MNAQGESRSRDVERGPSGILFVFGLVAVAAVFFGVRAMTYSPGAAKAEAAARAALPVLLSPTPFYVVVTATPVPATATPVPSQTPVIVYQSVEVEVPVTVECPVVDQVVITEFVEVPVTVAPLPGSPVVQVVTATPVPVRSDELRLCWDAEGVSSLFVDGLPVTGHDCGLFRPPFGVSTVVVEVRN